MKWEQFIGLPYYEDRLPPGADRALPGTYDDAALAKTTRDDRSMRSLPPTPLEKAENTRINKAYWTARKLALAELAPELLGLPRTQSADLRYLGVTDDYPDRMEQRPPREAAPRELTAEEQAVREAFMRRTIQQLLRR